MMQIDAVAIVKELREEIGRDVYDLDKISNDFEKVIKSLEDFITMLSAALEVTRVQGS